MSVGQGKSLRAHQHKMNRKISKTKTKVASIKERADAKKARAKALLSPVGSAPVTGGGNG